MLCLHQSHRTERGPFRVYDGRALAKNWTTAIPAHATEVCPDAVAIGSNFRQYRNSGKALTLRCVCPSDLVQYGPNRIENACTLGSMSQRRANPLLHAQLEATGILRRTVRREALPSLLIRCDGRVVEHPPKLFPKQRPLRHAPVMTNDVIRLEQLRALIEARRKRKLLHGMNSYVAVNLVGKVRHLIEKAYIVFVHSNNT